VPLTGFRRFSRQARTYTNARSHSILMEVTTLANSEVFTCTAAAPGALGFDAAP
jgi:hypothetical protein